MDVKLSDLIYYKENFLSTKDCKYFIDYYEKNKDNQYSEESLDSYQGIKKLSTFKAIDIKKPSQCHIKVRELVKVSVQEYMQHLDSLGLYNANIPSHFQYGHKFRILKYKTGEKIHPHSDHGNFAYGSVVLNLSGDYTGGQFCFFGKKISFELKQGDLMVFPADLFFIHEVTPIISGTRYSINTFIKLLPDEVIEKSNKATNDIYREYLNKTPDTIKNGPFFPYRLNS